MALSKAKFLKFSCQFPNERFLFKQYIRHNIGKRPVTDEKELTVKRIKLLPNNIPKSSFSAGIVTLRKPLAFTLVITSCSFVGAAIWQYENVRTRAFSVFKQQFSNENHFFRGKRGTLRQKANDYWRSLSEGQRVVSVIIALNSLVLLLWRIPQFQQFMIKYFSSNPAAKSVCWPMLLSTFSHYSFWHFAANMYVLWSFSSSIVSILGKEQFVAFYLSSAVISSFSSCLYKVLLSNPGVSLGASGAIMGVLGAVCTQIPHATLAIVFLPMFTFSAGSAIKAILLFDSTGIILGWKFFDHAAHLGGALFGIWYISYGQNLIWHKREPLMKWWHNLREGASKSK